MSTPFRTDRIVECAKKDHRCSWCGETIPKGTQYAYVTGYTEDFWAGKLHPECYRAEAEYWRHPLFKGEYQWPEEYMVRGSLVSTDCKQTPLALGQFDFSREPLRKEELR